jgi:hypothetical protein
VLWSRHAARTFPAQHPAFLRRFCCTLRLCSTINASFVARDAIARLNAACALLRSHRLYLLIRLRAPQPPTHSFSPFFHTSRVAPASMTFLPLAALAEYFYCEHCLF